MPSRSTKKTLEEGLAGLRADPELRKRLAAHIRSSAATRAKARVAEKKPNPDDELTSGAASFVRGQGASASEGQQAFTPNDGEFEYQKTERSERVAEGTRLASSPPAERPPTASCWTAGEEGRPRGGRRPSGDEGEVGSRGSLDEEDEEV